MKEIKVNIISPTFCGQVSYEEAIKKYGLRPIPEDDIHDGLMVTMHIDGPFPELRPKPNINLSTSDPIDDPETLNF